MTTNSTPITPGQFLITCEADLVTIHFDGSGKVVTMPFSDALRFSVVLGEFVVDHPSFVARFDSAPPNPPSDGNSGSKV